MKEISNKLIEERKITWLLERIEEKIELMIDKFIDITHKHEFLQIQLWKRVTNNIARGAVGNTMQYVNRINNVIYPPDLDDDDRLHVARAFQFFLLINTLKKNIRG